MPNPELGKPISRLNNYKLTPYESDFIKLSQKVLIRLGIVPRKRDYRKYLGNLEPYGGSTWWALTRDSIEYIVNFVKNEKPIVSYFKNTSHPFEMFFQTILANSPFMKNVKRNLTYTDWKEGGAHPAMINKDHIDLFANNEIIDPRVSYGPGEFLFARKFSDKIAHVVDELDRLINERDKI